MCLLVPVLLDPLEDGERRDSESGVIPVHDEPGSGPDASRLPVQSRLGPLAANVLPEARCVLSDSLGLKVRAVRQDRVLAAPYGWAPAAAQSGGGGGPCGWGSGPRGSTTGTYATLSVLPRLLMAGLW
jgi:hypothetical protein